MSMQPAKAAQPPQAPQGDLFVPDRFDMLVRRVPKQLDSIVVPVDAGLEHVKTMHADLRAAGRGGFLILRGDSGSGKSTFVNTLGTFLAGINVLPISREEKIPTVIRALPPATGTLRVVVVEGRDALRDVGASELEASIHDINSFVRSERGERTLVIWPANADDLEGKLIELAGRVGGDALLGTGKPSFRFSGPPKDQFLDIANRTIATLNQGASLADLGVSAERAASLIEQASTIGSFLGLLRGDLVKNRGEVDSLISTERCRMWVVVAASNDPEGDIAGLTRGALSSADIERLLGATNANIVQELRAFPEKLGILGAVLDAKILHLPMVTASAVCRDFKEQKLQEAMAAQGLNTAVSNEGAERLADSEIGRAFLGETMGTRTRGGKPGSNTIDAFKKLVAIAANNDPLLNSAIGRALVEAKLVKSFEVEKDLGTGLTRRSDIVCETDSLGIVRLEVMWRGSSGRAAIANYVLQKLANYGKAIGFLK